MADYYDGVTSDPNGSTLLKDGSSAPNDFFQSNPQVNTDQKTGFDAVTLPSPAVYTGQGGDGGGGQKAVVSIDAIRHVADSMTQLQQPLKDAIDKLDTIDIRAGGFATATNLRASIHGAGDGLDVKSLAGSFKATITSMLNGVTNIRSGLEDMATKYADADARNHEVAVDAAQSMGAAAGDFATLPGAASGNVNSTNTATTNTTTNTATNTATGGTNSTGSTPQQTAT